MLSAKNIRSAFDALSGELQRVGEKAELHIVGGAALVLLFEARETTKDVDAHLGGTNIGAIRKAAATVAEQLSLPEDWLNDGAKGYLVGLTQGEVVYESESLTVRAVSVEQLLAMKLAAWRDAIDRADAGLLLSKLSGSQQEVWGRVEPLVPRTGLDKAWYAFQDLWEASRGTD